jgi:hypothetical protein
MVSYKNILYLEEISKNGSIVTRKRHIERNDKREEEA